MTSRRLSQDRATWTAPLADFLASTGTTAFLVLKDNQLLFEGYLNGADRASTQTSFSTAKSFGSALIGVAIDEGHIASVDTRSHATFVSSLAAPVLTKSASGTC